jgi:Tfp pilus assembly protein PilF
MQRKVNISVKEKILIIYVFLALATLAVYWQVGQFDFVNIDDGVYVTENYHIQSGLSPDGLRWALSTTYAEFWHPLTWISLMLDYHLFGLNAGGYHMTNLILHMLSTLLLFRLFHRMTGAVWKSAFVAAFFSLHPLHVESVAWVAERKDVLSGFLFMLTLCLYVYYTEKPVLKRYLSVCFFFILALMSKSIVVTLPVLMILLDYWPLKRFQQQKNSLLYWQLKEKWPLFMMAMIFSIITVHARYPSYGTDAQISFGSRVANSFISLVTYTTQTIWPMDLSVFYPFPFNISLIKIIGAFFIVFIISTAVIVLFKRLPYLFVGWYWYLITLLPVLGIIQVGDFARADRYHYLPSIGIAVMMSWGIPSVIGKEKLKKKFVFSTGVFFLGAIASLSWMQCGYWRNSSSLFSHALEVTKDNYIAHNSFGLVLYHDNRDQEAIEQYNKAIGVKPDYVYAYNNRGIVYGKLKQYQLALDDFNEVISRMPFVANAFNNRGYTYDQLGENRLAMDDYNKAIDLKPDYAEAYSNRGMLYLEQGDMTMGCNDLRQACTFGHCKTLEAAIKIGLCPAPGHNLK